MTRKNASESELIAGAVLGIVLFIILYTVLAVINGFVFSMLWGWFVAPVFGLKLLSIPESVGLMIIITMPFAAVAKEADKTKLLLISFLNPVLILLTGYVVSLFL
jgi:hypothetical protein